jgi:hypothetical protein
MLDKFCIDLDFVRQVCRREGEIVDYFHKCDRIALVSENILVILLVFQNFLIR